MDDPAGSTLLYRATIRDEAAWRRLVDLFTPLVGHWCRRAGVPDSAVADVTQDVFQAVWAGLTGYRKDDGPFRSWVRGITRYKIADHFRVAAKAPISVGGSDGQTLLGQVPDPETVSFEEVNESAVLSRRGLELLQGEFEVRTWQAFWRTAVDGRSAAETAAELGMTTGAVRVAKSRVLRRLREELGDILD
jgi:RNA polymerase sigma-70 factor (ECF subfamily)